MLDTGCWILDAGYWILEAGHWKLDPGPFALIDSVREMMGIALLYQGSDFSSVKPKELKAAADLLIQTKKRQN